MRRAILAAILATAGCDGDRFVLSAPPVEDPCPPNAPEWRGIPICDERELAGFDPEAIDSPSRVFATLSMPTTDDGEFVYTAYACAPFPFLDDFYGTAAALDRVVSAEEAYESGLRPSQYGDFARHWANEALAHPILWYVKAGRDAAEWNPLRNRGWYAETVVQVKQTLELSVDEAERVALEAMLAADTSRTLACP